MNKKFIKKELIAAINLFNQEITKASAENLEKLLDKYLISNPFDTNMWVNLALTVYLSPLHDDLKAINCLKKILEYEPKNIKMTLLLVYIIDHCIYLDEELFRQLCELEPEDNQLRAMIEYVKSWYYFDRDENLYQYVLEKSIEYCDQFVWNHIKLGQFYLYKNNLEKGYHHLKKGLNNIEYTYDEQHSYGDVLNVEEFFNERFKGIHISQANYEIILESFDPKSPWITGDFVSKRNDGLIGS